MKNETLLTLKEANEIHAEWMKIPSDIDRKELAEWTRKRWNRLPDSYLSICDNGTAAAIIYKGQALTQAFPIQEQIVHARSKGIQTQLAWNGSKGCFEEIAPY
jgi:hypothetical protein